MALELESKIMSEIGLGNHFNWYNGSDSCVYIRHGAVNKIGEIIKKYHDAGELIAEPDKNLIDTLKKIATFGDVSNCSLTNTWQAASDVITGHIYQVRSTDQDRNKFFEKLKKFIEERYLPKEESFRIGGIRRL